MLSGNVVIYVLDYNFISKKMALVTCDLSKLLINAINLLISSSYVPNFDKYWLLNNITFSDSPLISIFFGLLY